jgi:putative flippase GtrA
VETHQVETPMTTSDVVAPEQPPAGMRTPIDGMIRAVAGRFGAKRAKEMERFLRFAVVGASGAVIDLGLLFILQQTIIPPTRGLTVALASGIAFFAAVMSNFIWTRYWVYPESRSRSMRRQLAMFTTVSVIGGAFRVVWMALLAFPIGERITPLLAPIIQSVTGSFEVTRFTEARIGSVVAQLIAMVVIMLWNFFANRYWTYNDVR